MTEEIAGWTACGGGGGGGGADGVFVIIIFFESFGARVDRQEWRANIKLERFREYIVEISRKSGLVLCKFKSNPTGSSRSRDRASK